MVRSTPTFVLEKIAHIVQNGSKPTQQKLCHARTAKWIVENPGVDNYIALWGNKSNNYVYHSGIIDNFGNLSSSYYVGSPDHKVMPNGNLFLGDNEDELDLVYTISVSSFKKQYLSILEDTVSSDLNINLAKKEKPDNHNKGIYNEPENESNGN